MLRLINFTNLTIHYSIIVTMPKSTDSIKKDISQITTYQSGVAQAAAHRLINRVVTDYLLSYSLTPMQWFVIGHVYDCGKSGCRLSDLARALDTTLPYITNTVNLLESKGAVRKVAHAGDSRIKLVSVTPGYRQAVREIEKGLRERMREKLYGEDRISRTELQDYIHVLYKIIG